MSLCNPDHNTTMAQRMSIDSSLYIMIKDGKCYVQAIVDINSVPALFKLVSVLDRLNQLSSFMCHMR